MARRAAEREARLVGYGLRRGVDGLGTVSATATWWGLALTCWHLATMFKGCPCGNGFPSRTFMAMSSALLPVAGSLLLALISSAGHSYFFARAEELASEAHFAAQEWRW